MLIRFLISFLKHLLFNHLQQKIAGIYSNETRFTNFKQIITNKLKLIIHLAFLIYRKPFLCNRI